MSNLISAINTEKLLLLKLEDWARNTNSKDMRRRLCRLMHQVSQSLAKLRDTLNTDIEERR